MVVFPSLFFEWCNPWKWPSKMAGLARMIHGKDSRSYQGANVWFELDFLGKSKWYGWWLKSCTSWYVGYPIIYRVSYIPVGAGFQPSTVCFKWWVIEELFFWVLFHENSSLFRFDLWCFNPSRWHFATEIFTWNMMECKSGPLEEEIFRFHVSSHQNPGYIGGYTTQSKRDHNEPW